MTPFATCRPSTMTKAQFVETFGGVYEHSPWVAEAAFGEGLDEVFDAREALHHKMSGVLSQANREAKLQVILAHPDLAGKAALAGNLTAESTAEQASAGIDQCTEEEFSRFTVLNERYKTKFGFPFIMAVKGANRHLILDAFALRLENDADTEFENALAEINKIAWFRLCAL